MPSRATVRIEANKSIKKSRKQESKRNTLRRLSGWKKKTQIIPFVSGTTTAKGVKRRRRKSKKIIRKGGKSRRRS